MRIVLGIDQAQRWETAFELLTRLRFREAVVDTVHVTEPASFYLGEPLKELPRLFDAAESGSSSHLVAESAARLNQEGIISGATSVSHGPAASELMHYADKVEASLITVGSSGKSALRAFFIGSVGRGLVINARQSILIARGEKTNGKGVRAVFATDHSFYANACIETLLELCPTGISHLTVLTVYPKDSLQALRPFLPDFVLNPSEWIEEGLDKRNHAVIDRLQPLGSHFESRVETGTVHEAIQKVMEEQGADLLILGAQGHGYVDRLTLGSVSFHEAFAGPHSVLVLRAPV